jgi:peptidoglycan/xylan/chitin deacetylase (PgdA/CDA1 family)
VEPTDYGPFRYVPITRRPKIVWPGEAQLAVWVIPNIEFFSLKDALSGHSFEGKGPVPSVRAWAQRDYGNRVGIWRIMDVLTKHGIRASPTVNSDICEFHPEIIAEAVKLGWELVGHNKTNSQRLNAIPPEQERELIRSVIRPASFCGVVGYKPSFAAINRYGVKPLSEALDTVGVMARSVADAALLVSVMTGRQAWARPPQVEAPRIGVWRTPTWGIWTLFGVPAITIPAAQGPNGLPVGIQIIGGTGRDIEALAVSEWAMRVLGPRFGASMGEHTHVW